MRTERSPMRMTERDQCVSGIRTNESREKGHKRKIERDQYVYIREIRKNENREKFRKEKRKGSVCKWD
jgi:hypothetical protein